MKKNRKDERDMPAIKPIRPTEISFESDDEMLQFLNYATDNKKTNNEALERIRKLMRNHKSANRRK